MGRWSQNALSFPSCHAFSECHNQQIIGCSGVTLASFQPESYANLQKKYQRPLKDSTDVQYWLRHLLWGGHLSLIPSSEDCLQGQGQK